MRMEYTPEMRVSSERGCPRASHEACRWRHRPGSMCSSVRCSSASMVLTMYLLRLGARVEVWAAVGFGQGLGLGHRGGVGLRVRLRSTEKKKKPPPFASENWCCPGEISPSPSPAPLIEAM